MPGNTWTDAMERQLLLGVIQASSVSSPNWDQVALIMGDGHTASGVKQKFNKIKKAANEEFGKMGDVPKGSAPKGKPKPRGAGSAKKTGGKRKGKDESEGEVEGSEGGDDDESPSKKVKVKAEAKEEGEGEDEMAF